jgi:hypothetical protein
VARVFWDKGQAFGGQGVRTFRTTGWVRILCPPPAAADRLENRRRRPPPPPRPPRPPLQPPPRPRRPNFAAAFGGRGVRIFGNKEYAFCARYSRRQGRAVLTSLLLPRVQCTAAGPVGSRSAAQRIAAYVLGAQRRWRAFPPANNDAREYSRRHWAGKPTSTQTNESAGVGSAVERTLGPTELYQRWMSNGIPLTWSAMAAR